MLSVEEEYCVRSGIGVMIRLMFRQSGGFSDCLLSFGIDAALWSYHLGKRITGYEYTL